VIRLAFAVLVRPITTFLHFLPMTQSGGFSAPIRTSIVYSGVVLTGGGTSPSTSPRVTLHVIVDAGYRTRHLLRAPIIGRLCFYIHILNTFTTSNGISKNHK